MFTTVYSEVRVWNRTEVNFRKKENCESWILGNEEKNVTSLKRLTDTLPKL